MINSKLDLLVDVFKSLPGVGTKAAEKMAYFILEQDDHYVDNFVKRIYDAKKKLGQCLTCNYLTDKTNGDICEFCANASRNHNQICVVADVVDALKIENLQTYQGVYYVINGEIGRKRHFSIVDLKLEKLLINLQENLQIQEVIIATNPTVQGELTAKYLNEVFKSVRQDLNIYRLGFGLPYNCQINYADDFSLEHSLLNKQKMNN